MYVRDMHPIPHEDYITGVRFKREGKPMPDILYEEKKENKK